VGSGEGLGGAGEGLGGLGLGLGDAGFGDGDGCRKINKRHHMMSHTDQQGLDENVLVLADA